MTPAASAGAASGAAHRVPPLRISAVGDTILGTTPQVPLHPRAWFDRVRRPMRRDEDVVFGNLEGTFTHSTASKCGGSSGGGCYAFRNPPAFANAFADVGFTILNNANNHSHDFGAQGLTDTRVAIHEAGMRHTGMPGEVAYQRAHGIRVGVVGFAPYSNTADMLDYATAAALVKQAADHANLVVVYMHAGAEGADRQHVTGHEEYYLGEDRGNPKRFAHRMVDAGADLVIGSGPHVLRGMQFYRGKLIAYSLGNFASFHNFDTGGVLGDSAILRVALGPAGVFRSGRLVPVHLDSAGYPSRGGPSLDVVRRLSKEDFGLHAARLSQTGVISKPTR